MFARSAKLQLKLTQCLLALVLVMGLGVGVVKGQRIYADAQTNTATLFAGVTSAAKSVTIPYTDYTTIYSALGLLDLIEASQIISFSGINKPTPSTPITIKFGATNSLLNLLNGIFIQPTINGGTVGLPYSNNTLISLLSALGTPMDAEITLPAPGINYDGIRFRVSSSLLGALITTRLYYASFIVAPTSTSKAICNGSSVILSIDNFQSGYTYNWYTSSTATVPIYSSTNQKFSPATNLTNTTTYYVEAVETYTGTNYYSGRTAVTVTVYAKPSKTQLISISTN
jgi:hypothetical protein